MRNFKDLPSINNVGAGMTAVLECPLGRTYDRITFHYTGTAVTRAMLKNIQVEIGGKPIQTYKDADRLQDLNDFYGREDTADYITLYFVRPEMHNLTQQRTTGIGTVDISSLTVRMDIDASAPGDLAIEASAMLSEPQLLGLINKVRSFPTSSDVIGEKDISNIPRRARIQAMHFFKADISKVVVEMDSIQIYEASKELTEVVQSEHGRVPVTAKATHVDFQLEGDNGQALVMDGVQEFRVKPTFDSTGPLDVMVEYLDGLKGL
jgi:coat protein